MNVADSQTDRRQTDGRAIAYIEREREFKNGSPYAIGPLSVSPVLSVCLFTICGTE